MNIALVQLWSPPYIDNRSGGPVYSLATIADNLSVFGHRCELIHFNSKLSDQAWHKQYNVYKEDKAAEVLNKFDRVIFSTAGSWTDRKLTLDTDNPWYSDMLDKLTVPFIVQILDEVEPKVLLFRNRFFYHPQCIGTISITGEVKELVAPNSPVPNLVYPVFPINYNDIHWPHKTKSVKTTCRMTTRKRVLELVKQSTSLAHFGFSLDIHGADITWMYAKQVKDQANDHWTYHGSFLPSDVPSILNETRYHYNASYLKIGTFIPRLEIATIEAVLNYKCVPILCKYTVPKWINDSNAILVDPTNMNDLAERLEEKLDFNIMMVDTFINDYFENIQPYHKTIALCTLLSRE